MSSTIVDPTVTATTTATIAERLAAMFQAIGAGDVPASVRTAARHSILDWLGCAIAGSREPLSVILRDELLDDAGGSSTVIGDDRRRPMLTAALINGATGHALDFDDTNLRMMGHPTTAVLPAVLALAEHEQRAGADVVTALVVGTEVATRVANVLGADHYERGWHATGTAGIFGAAAGCSWLLGLDRHRFALALALAGSQAGGLKA